MYSKFKNHIYTNFLAFAGFLLLWYILKAIVSILYVPQTTFGTSNIDRFEWLTSIYFCPYMFLTLVAALILFIVEYAYKKNKNTPLQKQRNSKFYNIFFNVGFSLYIFFSIFFILYTIYFLLLYISLIFSFIF